MTDLPTLEAAMKLADQDSPLPSLAGPALKVLRTALQTAMLRPESVVAGKIINTLSNSRRGFHLEISADMGFFVGQEVWITKQPPAEVVECGGCAPPVAASPVYGVDHGAGDDKTTEVFGHHDAKGVLHIEDIVESAPDSLNSGHGHVRPRPDGVKARCGGPMMCRICAKELDDMFGVPGDDKCWCSTCRPITAISMRMALCPTCGNKRCPHAHDHRNACTGSNAVGQPGSSWEHVEPFAPPAPEHC